MSAMWACYRCGEIGKGELPDIHAYRDCDVSMQGEDFARARVAAWNAAIEAAEAVAVTPDASGRGTNDYIARRIRALKREVKP